MWKPISECPEDTKGVFGYWDQFDSWVFNIFGSKDQPEKYGYTHWLDMNPPQRDV
jgi:hypothetical protein